MSYSRVELEAKNREELRTICGNLGVYCTTKTRKDDLIDGIIEKTGEVSSASAALEVDVDAPEYPGDMDSISSVIHAHRGDDETNLLVSVSCGSSNGNFPVVGKSVTEVSNFLREILNISATGEPIVNGSRLVLSTRSNSEMLSSL